MEALLSITVRIDYFFIILCVDLNLYYKRKA